MKITGMKIEKVQIPLKEPVKVAFATVSYLESVLAWRDMAKPPHLPRSPVRPWTVSLPCWSCSGKD